MLRLARVSPPTSLLVKQEIMTNREHVELQTARDITMVWNFKRLSQSDTFSYKFAMKTLDFQCWNEGSDRNSLDYTFQQLPGWTVKMQFHQELSFKTQYWCIY